MYNYAFKENDEHVLNEAADVNIKFDKRNMLVNILLTNKNVLVFYDTERDSALKTGGMQVMPEFEILFKVGGKTFQSFHNGGVGQFESFVNALAFDKFRCHAAGCNSRTAAESLEANVLNNAVIVDFQEHLHDIAAFRIADHADAVCILDFAHIARMCKVIHNFFGIHIDLSSD